MNVLLITIGDEVLLGDTVDTNSTWLSRQLSEINLPVIEKITVGDEKSQILDAFKLGFERSDLVIVTGGLGPTNDDKTKDCLSLFFNTPLVVNPDLYNKVEYYFNLRGMDVSGITPKMVEIPQSAEMISNNFGVAPGLWFNQDGKQLIALPGVPIEMEGIMTEEILPRLSKSQDGVFFSYHYFLTAGKGETILANRIEDIENNLPSGFSIAYLPAFSSVKIRITGKGTNQEQLEYQTKQIADQIRPHLVDVLFSEDRDGSLVKTIMSLANSRKETLAVAESCTGGNIAHQITLVPGSSSYFLGGVVAYSNQVKEHVLSVPKTTIDQFGAVSEAVVEAMVKGSLQLFNSTYALAVSGIAGPDGGTKDKPVGTVCIAVGNNEKVISKTFTFAKNREKNIELSSTMALDMLYKLMMESTNEM